MTLRRFTMEDPHNPPQALECVLASEAEAEIAALYDYITDLALERDGVKHSRACPNNVASGGNDLSPCLRCQVEELTAQLPDGMKHCTIEFNECANGHGRLTATNWVQHGCQTCEIAALTERAERAEQAVRDSDAMDAASEERKQWAACACMVDQIDDVCLIHSPAVDRMRAERDAALARVADLDADNACLSLALARLQPGVPIVPGCPDHVTCGMVHLHEPNSLPAPVERLGAIKAALCPPGSHGPCDSISALLALIGEMRGLLIEHEFSSGFRDDRPCCAECASDEPGPHSHDCRRGRLIAALRETQ